MLSRLTSVCYFVFAVGAELWGAIRKRLRIWAGSRPR
jgi:hypothetical protein